MTLPKIKKETNASLQLHRKFPAGTILAVDLYTNGNYFEAVLKDYRTDKGSKNSNFAYVHYLDDKETKGWVDLNTIKVVELTEENILTREDCVDKYLTDEKKGFLGRRLTVQWMDDARYTGTITKIMKNKKNFVFITYDNGDKCWYNLSPEAEHPSRCDETQSISNKKTDVKTTSKSSTRIKKESTNATDELPTTKKSNVDAEFKKHLMARKELEKKYPIGCTISVDIYHDEHYHDAIVKKYLTNANKRQQAKGEHWVYIQFLDKAKTKQWIDLSCIKVIKMTPDKVLELKKVKPGDDKGFLGNRIMVVWPDGNKYHGLATRSAKDNKHFVFLEYDDGDECWCDLQRESEWSIDGEHPADSNDDDDIDNDDNNSSDASVEVEKSRAKPKRKGNAEVPGQSTKKAKPTEDSYNF